MAKTVSTTVKRVKFFLFSRRTNPHRNVNCKEAQNALSASIERLRRVVWEFWDDRLPRMRLPRQ